jgi:hypothetical protein
MPLVVANKESLHGGKMVANIRQHSDWNINALEVVLKDDSTTLETGLFRIWRLGPKDLHERVAALTAIRDINERYSQIRFHTTKELLSLVTNLIRREGKANIVLYDLQAMLRSADENNLYLWNETGVAVTENEVLNAR